MIIYTQNIRTVAVFELVLLMRDKRTSMIMKELYAECIRWNDVTDGADIPLGKGSIALVRKKGIAAVIEAMQR